MTKADIFSGFLGAGKTTLIKKLITEAYSGEKLVLIENEFGDIGIDGGFMQEAGIQVNELNSGCICCSLVGDFRRALGQVIEEYHPDRILIEPSGVGALSDIERAVASVDDVEINSATVVVDPVKAKMYLHNFGDFYKDQLRNARLIVLSRTDSVKPEKLDACLALIREYNPDATIITTPWDKLDGKAILAAMESTDSLKTALEGLEHEHHHPHHDGEHCSCGCEDDDDEHEHHHDHDHDGHCSCGCEDGDEHEHHHHHHHHEAEGVFVSWGVETAKKFDAEALHGMLEELDGSGKYGTVLRAKGIVDSADGQWLHFDYVPGEYDVRRGPAGLTGRLCVIGSGLDTGAIKKLFGV